MASRMDPKAMGQKKLVTYGKSSRKRLSHEPLPLRSTTPTNSGSGNGARPSNSGRATLDPYNFTTEEDEGKRGGSRATVESKDGEIVRKRRRTHTAPEDIVNERKVSPKAGASAHSLNITSRDRLPTGLNSVRPRQNTAIGAMRAKSTNVKTTPSESSRQKDDSNMSSSVMMHKLHRHRSRNLDSPNRRPRLIDTLTAQRPRSPGSESEQDEICFSQPPSQTSQETAPQAAKPSQAPRPRLKARPGAGLQGSKVKYTYGQSRTILSGSQERSAAQPGSQEDELDALLSIPPNSNTADPFAMDDEDDVNYGGGSKDAIKSVHELRRAGANTRFSHEMDDILAGIVAPSASSARRDALLELGCKLQRKDFITQFRDHAARDDVTQNIGLEEDIISGFALVACLVTFLTFSPAAHLVRQLLEDRVDKLLDRLLSLDTDIEQIASERRLKLPRSNRIALSTIKTSLMQKDIWHGYGTQHLSPQALGLQLLKLLCLRTDLEDSYEMVRSLRGNLAVIMDRYARPGSETDATFALLVSILETQSSVVMDSNDESPWISQQAPNIAHFLQSALKRWPDRTGDDISTTLKLSINTTNTAEGAGAFNSEILLSSLSGSIHSGFMAAQDAINNRRLRDETYDGLLLILGVAINILEHCPAARESFNGMSLKTLVTLYLENRVPASEVDSVDKSKLSVAFGYLAVLLGYLSLSVPARRAVVIQTQGQGIEELIGSIQEFIAMYRSVDTKVHELEGLVHKLQQTSG